MPEIIDMVGVTEYCEEMMVTLEETSGLYEPGIPEENYKGRGRLVVCARNEGGYNGTAVDLLELIAWLKEHRPDLLT